MIINKAIFKLNWEFIEQTSKTSIAWCEEETIQNS